ncbi:MAG: hypothetical protein R3E96_08080 [Planctomycetota bacterium]
MDVKFPEECRSVPRGRANVLVAGTAIFKAPDRAQVIQELRGAPAACPSTAPPSRR